MAAPSVTGPHDVPNLRLYLLDRWRVGGVYEHAAQVMWSASQHIAPYGWKPREEADWQRMYLRDPDLTLWWVSAEMVDEISHVAAELPDDVRPEDIPGLLMEGPEGGTISMCGLVILEKQIVGVDAMHEGQPVAVDGFLYGGTRLPPVHGRPWRLSTSVSTYRRLNYDAGLDSDQLGAASPLLLAEGIGGSELQRAAEEAHQTGATSLTVDLHGDEWVPLGRSDWPFIDQLRDRIDPTVSDAQHQSLIEDRRWIAALHLVAEDHRVATVERVVPANKLLRRPSERRKLGTAVRVIYLRKFDESGDRSGRAAGGRSAPRAHIVRSHPRWQPYGPGREFRKMILVPRHARGHGGGPPMEGPPTVRAVV